MTTEQLNDFEEWEADDRPALITEYRDYLRSAIDDDGFDLSEVEDYGTWAREEYARALEEGREEPHAYTPHDL